MFFVHLLRIKEELGDQAIYIGYRLEAILINCSSFVPSAFPTPPKPQPSLMRLTSVGSTRLKEVLKTRTSCSVFLGKLVFKNSGFQFDLHALCYS